MRSPAVEMLPRKTWGHHQFAKSLLFRIIVSEFIAGAESTGGTYR